MTKLTGFEVREDLEEIETLIMGIPLKELDGLRVLSSVYPVKPRIELKIPEHMKAAQRQAQLAQEMVGEDSVIGDIPLAELLEFFRLVEIVRPDILDGEREREQLESRYMVS